MVEVRCPMCSKSNPAEREVCQYCQARLKPVTPIDPAGSSAGQGAGDADIPDWLRSFRSDDSLQEEADEAPDSLPDWLRGRTGEPSQQDEANIPDWLTNLRGPADEDPQGEETPEDAGWLSAFSKDAEDEPDSLSLPSSPDEKSQAGETSTDADWPAAPASSEADETDWFNLRASAGEDHLPDETLDKVDLPDWLSETLPDSEPIQPNETDEPEWLQNIRSRQQMDAAPVPTGLEEQSGAEDGSTEEQPVMGEQVATEEQVGTEERVGAEVFALEDEQTGPEGEFPSWLSDVDQKSDALPQEETPEPEAEPAVQGGDMPAWLAELAGETDDDFLPSWLQKPLAAGQEKSPLQTETSQPEIEPDPFAAASLPGSFLDDADQDNDWLKDFASEELEGLESETPKSASSPFTLDEESQAELAPLMADDLPEWLKNIRPGDPELAGAASGTSLDPVDFSDEEESQATSAGAAVFDIPSPGEAGMAPAELPSWLEAMRPVDTPSQLSDDSTGQLESAGPLAGIRGVLPAEPDISQTGKAAGFQMKLQVSDAQQANAALFEKLIKSEDEAQPVIARRLISPQHILRILVGILLFLAVLTPLLWTAWTTPIPSAPVPEILDVYTLISQVEINTPVLVAFDYDPGWSGEMDALAAPILDHLMQRGAHLVFVSTSPTGPALAERVLARTNQYPGRNPVYQAGMHYTNLGFIPGGPAGLLAFAQSPLQVLPGSWLNGPTAWEQPALQGISVLNQFDLAFVFTENPETARTWVEQVNPVLDGTPLIMAVSAQADPLVRPYYSAGANQLAGLLSGLEGGLYYEGLNGRSEAASRYWASFSLGHYAAAGLLLIGGVWYALSGMLERRKLGEVEGQA